LRQGEELWILALSYLKGIGPQLARSLISFAGGAKAVFDMKDSDWKSVPGIGKRRWSRTDMDQALTAAGSVMDKHRSIGVSMMSYLHPEFPRRLLHCPDSPLFIFKNGRKSFNTDRVLAIVGTRKVSSYGKNFIHQLGDGLKGKDILVVSGLAFGVDTLAHKMALDAGLDTCAVMGTGFDILYPSQNRALAQTIGESAGLISEYPYGYESTPANFAMRNRIIAGMSDGVLVVETATKGGAMITARIANSYNRDVMAVPGRVGDLYSSGCNSLIRNHEAHLVESAADILRLMNWDEAIKPRISQASLALELNEEEMLVANTLRESGELSIDAMAIKLSMPVSKLSVLLLEMELKSFLREIPGKRYALNM
jgi:DNA processing protein